MDKFDHFFVEVTVVVVLVMEPHFLSSLLSNINSTKKTVEFLQKKNILDTTKVCKKKLNDFKFPFKQNSLDVSSAKFLRGNLFEKQFLGRK